MTIMKGVLLATLLSTQPSLASRDGWFGVDKVKHFFMSAFIQSVTFAALETAGADRSSALAGASGVTVGMGLAKEWYDMRSGGAFSFRDLGWGVAGGAAASLILVRTQR